MNTTHHGILCSLKKEGNPVMCYSVDGPQGHFAEQEKSVTEGHMLYDSTHGKYLK